MEKTARRGLLAVAISVALSSSLAVADDSGFEINAALGHYFFENDRDLDNDPFWGVGLGYALNSRWTLEAWYTDANLETDIGGVDVDGEEYRFDALYHLAEQGGVTPYIVAGVGDMTYDASFGESDETRLNLGIGIKKPITERLNLRGDFRLFNSLDHEMTDTGFQVALNYSFGSKTPAVVDSDGDGVLDDVDACPNSPVGSMVNERGCPLDSDGDGVLNINDQCPDTPAGVEVGVSGCPIDSDGDGVFDYRDQCPDTLTSLAVDGDGCPVPLTETVSVEMTIKFDFDSARVKPVYRQEIKKLANFLMTYPSTRVEIQGHTDSSGSDAYNLRLSQKRAEAVAAVIINEFQIDADRVSAKGYGESQPVMTNDTDEGREANRRVVAELGTTVEKLKTR